MLSIYNIKPRFQNFLRPVLTFFFRRGITANQITICSILLSAVISACFWFAESERFLFLALPIGLFVRMALNALDGMMARTYHQQSRTGELLNELGDAISDLLIFFPLLKHEQTSLYLVVIFMCMSLINEFSGVMGKVIKGERRYEGPMGKSDRAFVIGIYGLLSFFSVDMTNAISAGFILVIFLLTVSTIIRIKKTLE